MFYTEPVTSNIQFIYRTNTPVFRFGVALILFLLSILPLQCYAISVALDKDESIDEQRTGWLPYVFRTDSLGTALGVGIFSVGRNQPQSGIIATGYLTDNDSALVMVAITNYQVPGSERLFFDVFAMKAHFTDQRFYVDLNHDPTQPKAGSNDSVKNDFVSGVSNKGQLEFTLKYPFKIGSARDNPISIYHLDRGLLNSGPQGGKFYDPVHSGKTVLAAKLFHTYSDLSQFPSENLLSVNSNGIELSLDHDNTDFPRNASEGSRQKITITRDFGWLERSDSWTNMELALTKYINLGTSTNFRQKVLALNFWTSNTLSWETDPSNDQIVTHRPPPGIGSSLGGYDRMRAFPIARFHDKAATYYSAEIRMIPYLNPLADLPLLNYFKIDWMQLVGFVEAGRVGPAYNSKLFFDDLKFDAGISMRLMTYNAVVRLDWAISDEGNSIWAMYEQTFAR